MSDANTLIHFKQGGDELHFDAGSTLNVDPNATVIGLTGETKEVGDLSTTGGITFIHKYTITGVTGDTDIILDNKTLVLDVWATKSGTGGGAGDLITVKKLTIAITDDLDLNVPIDTVVRAGKMIGAPEILAAGVLRVSAVNASNVACDVFVLGMRIP